MITLFPMDNFNPGDDSKETLKNGLVRYYKGHTECGGNFFRDILIERIEQYGKPHYNRGFEWCAGSGPLGYALLDEKLVDHISFSDCYDKAIELCLLTAKNNNIETLVEAYISPKISQIPQTKLWDIVVSNPPHVWDKTGVLTTKYPSEENMFNQARMLVDQDMETHKEFFSNIRSRLNEDADLFIIEHDSGAKQKYIDMAEAGGLKFIEWYDFSHPKRGNTFPHKLLHFKPK